MREKIITHKGEVYHWRCFWGYGSYYENEKGFVLTNGKGEVDFASAHAREIMRDGKLSISE